MSDFSDKALKLAKNAWHKTKRIALVTSMWVCGVTGGVLAGSSVGNLLNGANLEYSRQTLIAAEEQVVATCFEKQAQDRQNDYGCHAYRFMAAAQIVNLENQGLDGRPHLVAGGLKVAFSAPLILGGVALNRRRKKIAELQK